MFKEFPLDSLALYSLFQYNISANTSEAVSFRYLLKYFLHINIWKSAVQCFLVLFVVYIALCCVCAAVPLGCVVGGGGGFMSRCKLGPFSITVALHACAKPLLF